jgi:gliding motility-associated-like protein
MAKYFILLIPFVFSITTWAEKTNEKSNTLLLCSQDVIILEGSTISFCQGEIITINASPGFVSYAWTGPQFGTNTSLNPTVSGEYIVSAVDGIGCVSSDTILVTVNTNPIGIIVSSEGTELCPGDAGTSLSLQQAYANYLWGDGSTNYTLLVNTGGTYTVNITDFNGCEGNSAITINQPNFEITVLESAIVCNGSSATISASGGTSYLWSTGETSSSIIVSPPITLTYSVTISKGSCSQNLTQTITKIELTSAEIQDTFFVAAGAIALLEGPENYMTYNWTPTTDISANTTQEVTFSGSESMQYLVVSEHTNGCVREDSIWVFVVKLTIPTGFSPNGDLINDNFVIPELGDFPAKITIFNRWGDVVFETDHYLNDWDGTCKTSICLGEGRLPEGTYFYSIEAGEIHFDGYTTIKL